MSCAENRPDPRHLEAELERAVGVGPALVVVGRGHVGEDGLQVRRRFDGALYGSPTERARAVEADVAGRPGLGGGPLDRVVAVAGFVAVGAPGAFRAGAAARLLDDDGVAPLRPTSGLKISSCIARKWSLS